MKKCIVPNCNEFHEAQGYCHRHYRQWQRHGKILSRTRKDKNEYVVSGTTTKIFLYNRKQEKVAEAIIDTIDLEKCKKYRWWLNPDGYVRGTINQTKYQHLSWVIVGKTKHSSLVVDHIDGNKLNNKRKNLQLITHQENVTKQGLHKNNTSGYRGISFNKRYNRWGIKISINKVTYRQCNFVNIDEAIKAYNKKYKEMQ